MIFYVARRLDIMEYPRHMGMGTTSKKWAIENKEQELAVN